MCEDFLTDENYQLELNLYNIRRELISMLEVFEKSLCTVCLNLKCSCSKDKNKIEVKLVNGNTDHENNIADGWTVQGAKDTEKSYHSDTEKVKKTEEEDEESDDVDQNDSIAPPASSLPKPKWDSPKKEKTSSAPEKEPVHPDIEAWIEASRAEAKIIKEPILLQNLHYIDTQKKFQNIYANGNGVDAFFKYFKMSNDTAVTYVSTKLAAACSTPVRKNYTYF